MQKYTIRLLMAVMVMACTQLQAQVKIAPSYNFTLGITYEMTGNKSGSKTTQTTFWFSDKNYSGIELPQNKSLMMVYDLPNKQMLTIMSDNKMIMVMDLGKMEKKLDSINKKDGVKAGNSTLTKTGKTEKILGYNCDQYQFSSDKGKSLIWVTTELGKGMANFAQGLTQLLKLNPTGTGMPELKGMSAGVMLKMETLGTDGTVNSKLEAKAVLKEGKTVSTAGFKTMAMPGGQ